MLQIHSWRGANCVYSWDNYVNMYDVGDINYASYFLVNTDPELNEQCGFYYVKPALALALPLG